uniref:Uncharacterized protein n=1 Tax=Anguilla anguilla TaxID=7936 RepID=A0A0E9V3E4_ANGAN
MKLHELALRQELPNSLFLMSVCKVQPPLAGQCVRSISPSKTEKEVFRLRSLHTFQ